MSAYLETSRARVIMLALALVLAFSVGSVITAAGNDDGTTIYACLTPGGTINSVSTDSPPNCPGQSTLISWNQQGPPGEPGEDGAPGKDGEPGEDGQDGVFTGQFTSENGDYSISVTDDGIELSGPGTNISLVGGAAVVSGVAVTVDSAAVTNVSGALVQLNCPGGGGLGVARQTDLVQVDPNSGVGSILFGSATVLAC